MVASLGCDFLHLLKSHKAMSGAFHEVCVAEVLDGRHDCLHKSAYAALYSRFRIPFSDAIEAYRQLTKGILSFLAREGHMNEGVYDQ